MIQTRVWADVFGVSEATPNWRAVHERKTGREDTREESSLWRTGQGPINAYFHSSGLLIIIHDTRMALVRAHSFVHSWMSSRSLCGDLFGALPSGGGERGLRLQQNFSSSTGLSCQISSLEVKRCIEIQNWSPGCSSPWVMCSKSNRPRKRYQKPSKTSFYESVQIYERMIT